MFGKVGRISIIAPHGPCADRLLNDVLDLISRFEDTVRRDQTGSELLHLCGADVGRYVPVSHWFWHLLQLANDISYRTDGLFDVAAAGTGGIARWADIDLSQLGAVRLRRKMFLSLGGIVKGFAVDLAVKALQETGVAAGLVDIGGCIRSFGSSEWRIEFIPPQQRFKQSDREQEATADRAGVPVPLQNSSLAGCGSYFGGARLMDIEKGVTMSALEWGDTNLLVRAQSCAVADALSKVAAIRPESSKKILAQFGAEATVLTAFGVERLKYAS
ncbi:MAG: FAD:protein FMN transferase [Kordiimonadaceae bacterium]|nr:FAD:protein FMN transferase [Kordiimonadaceae bacterium]